MGCPNFSVCLSSFFWLFAVYGEVQWIHRTEWGGACQSYGSTLGPKYYPKNFEGTTVLAPLQFMAYGVRVQSVWCLKNRVSGV